MPEDALYLFAVTGSSTTSIRGIALSIFSKPSETATISEDISDVLEQVERIYFELAGEDIIVQVLNRAEYLDTVGRYFYYFQITPITVGSVLTQTEVQNIRINFYPYIKGQSFYNSEYNAIQNSINDQEKSTFLQIADRNTLDINPSNLNAILNDFATKAEIPDSNYTTAGWVNARYDGVESTETNYGGIPSAVSAIPFVGSYHPPSLTSVTIRSLTDDEKVIKTYVHTANSRFPSFEINPARLKILSAPAIGPTTGSISYNVYPLNSSIAVNNLLLITGSVGGEIVRITDYDLSNKILYVKRGIGGTGPKTFITYNIFPIFSNRIYELDGNRLNSIEEGKVLVRSTNVILKIDEFGVVYGTET
jgi:hypothetical protein